MFPPAPIPKYTAQQFCVIAPGNFFTPVWVPIERNFYMGQSEKFDSSSSVNNSWWIFTVMPQGQIFVPDPFPVSRAEAEALCAAALRSDDQTSILKVEVQYTLGNGMFRNIRFDIGAGKTILIPPAFNVMATILQPEPVPGSEVPPGFDPTLFVVGRLVIAVVCVVEPEVVGDTELTFTTPFHLQDPDVANTTIDVPVEAGAIAVEACFNMVPGSDLLLIQQRRDADGNVIDETVIVTVVLENATDTCFPKTTLPPTVNIIRYTELLAPPGISGTITQFLDFS